MYIEREQDYEKWKLMYGEIFTQKFHLFEFSLNKCDKL